MKLRPCNILILTCSIGGGHLSASRAIREAILRKYGKNIRVEIVDFLKTLKSLATVAAKTIYMGSLKLSPKIYGLLFDQTSEWQWPVKLLNILSAPFLQERFQKLIEMKKPDILVSTYPLWHILIGKIWERYAQNHAPFVCVITDSISVHPSWTLGNPDYFLVANSDTAHSLKNLGIPQQKIKAFGYPVAHRFFVDHADADASAYHKKNFLEGLCLSNRKKTLLLLLTEGTPWIKANALIRTIQKSSLKNLQLIIICGVERLKKRLQRLKWPWPVYIAGFTRNLQDFLHAADIVLTKAGGATVMECVSSKKPMVIFDAIPGHEIGNALFVKKHELGFVLGDDLKDLDEAVSRILKNESAIKKRLASQRKPCATEDIARFLIKLIKARSN